MNEGDNHRRRESEGGMTPRPRHANNEVQVKGQRGRKKATQNKIRKIVDAAYQNAFDAIEGSVRYHIKQPRTTFLDVANRAYRAGLIGSEQILRQLPRDVEEAVYVELEPAIREHVNKVTTVETYKNWGELSTKTS